MTTDNLYECISIARDNGFTEFARAAEYELRAKRKGVIMELHDKSEQRAGGRPTRREAAAVEAAVKAERTLERARAEIASLRGLLREVVDARNDGAIYRRMYAGLLGRIQDALNKE